MNREIKFRGKRTDDGEWVYGYYVRDLSGGAVGDYIFNCPSMTEVVPETVGQFTGLTDINGREIYEGDIIECLGSRNQPIRHQILFSPERGCLCQYGLEYEEWNDGYPNCGAITRQYISEHEKYVIGNIHEHKHLLTTK
jgi:hypothetical protein